MMTFKRLLLFAASISILPFAIPASATSEDNEEAHVRITTSKGDIVVELYPEKAPITVRNFLESVEAGAYDNSIFHRVISNFMIQGGGYTPELEELPAGETIPNEADNGLRNLKGTVAMARLNEIDSARRQFFINLADNAHLDHSADSCTREDEQKQAQARQRGLYKPLGCRTFGYAVFGKVIEGMDVVEQIGAAETARVDRFPNMPVEPIVIETVEPLK
ncbi:MAG: peptidylprolyl isomerase [Pseudomonadales bacterium]